jgi:hypothetical protein
MFTAYAHVHGAHHVHHVCEDGLEPELDQLPELDGV